MAKKNAEKFNIRQVIELTGISEFTLRGWENRYQAFKPTRSPTGRRFYSQNDLLKINYLQQLLHEGFKIGDIANLSTDKLAQMTGRTELPPVAEPPSLTPHHERIQKMIAESYKMNWNFITTKFKKSSTQYSPQDFIFDFILPLLAEMNALIEKQSFSISQEHIFSALIKESLFRIRSENSNTPHPEMRIAFATPEGELHEIGILIASTLAALRKKHYLYLGPNMPKEDLCETLIHFNATHILLATTIDSKNGLTEDLHRTINFMQRQLSPNTKILLAGRAAHKLAVNESEQVLLLQSFHEFDDYLRSHKK